MAALARKRVVGLGLCVVDHIYLVDRLDLGEPRTRYTARRVAPGGMVTTALTQAARLGCRTRLLSSVGNDPAGRYLRRSLRAAGVGTDRLVLSASQPTTVAVVLVQRRSGQRRFLVPDRRALERRAARFDLDAIDLNAVLLVDGHFPTQALRAVRRARRLGVRVIGDFSRPGPRVRQLLPFVDYPIVPLEFAKAYAAGDPKRALRTLRARYGGTPVVTLGARGGLYLGPAGGVRRYRPHRVAVRDTTGAGDAFHGAFAAALCHDLELEEALDLAARAAAVCCTGIGGTQRLMTREEARALRAR
ncbi:MAG: PfkB family carbohydrate kinase [Myxococcota bacterium]